MSVIVIMAAERFVIFTETTGFQNNTNGLADCRPVIGTLHPQTGLLVNRKTNRDIPLQDPIGQSGNRAAPGQSRDTNAGFTCADFIATAFHGRVVVSFGAVCELDRKERTCQYPFMQTEEKTIRFTPTRRDLLAFNIRTIAQNRIVIGMVGVGFLFIVISDSMYKPNPPVPFTVRFIAALLSGLIVALVGAVVGLVSVLLIIWTGKFKNVLTEQTATITDAGLAGTSATGEGVTKWTGIHKVDSTRRLLIIYTNETTARIIPKRCFPNPETAAAFEQEIRSRMKSG